MSRVKSVQRKKPALVINNKLKEYGTEQGGKIQINVKKHKGNKSELADTIKHELNHAKFPKASEKKIKKKTQIDMSKMSYAEKESLTKKLRRKALNYRVGAIKRKLTLAEKESESRSTTNRTNSIKKISILGLV